MIVENGRLSLGNNNELSRLERRCMLLFRLLILSDTLTELAGMCSIERLRKADLNAIIRRVFDHHPYPSRRLQDRPMAAKQLANGRKTKDLADAVLHERQALARKITQASKR